MGKTRRLRPEPRARSPQSTEGKADEVVGGEGFEPPAFWV